MALFRFGQCVLDVERRELTNTSKPVKLSPRAFEALVALLNAYPGAVAKRVLYAAVWPDTFVNLSTLDHVIAEIRQAIDDRAKRVIVTKHRFGYVIGVTVTRAERPRRGGSRFMLSFGRETIALCEGENLVGRSSEAIVLLDVPPVSRRHAIIYVAGDNAEIEDLESKNGTFVDGSRVTQRTALHDRVTVCFGSVCGILWTVQAGQTTATDPAVVKPA